MEYELNIRIKKLFSRIIKKNFFGCKYKKKIFYNNKYKPK